MVVGNGGIALELVHSLAHLEHLRSPSNQSRREREIIWAIKDRHLGNTFLDQAASAFVFPFLFPEGDPKVDPELFRSQEPVPAAAAGVFRSFLFFSTQ